MKTFLIKLLSKPMTDIEAALLKSLKDDSNKWQFNHTEEALFSVNRELGVSVKSKAGALGRFSASVGELDFGPYAAFVWHEAAEMIANDRQQLRKSRESENEAARLKLRLGLK